MVCIPRVRGLGSFPGQGANTHNASNKSPHASTKIWCGQINKSTFFFFLRPKKQNACDGLDGRGAWGRMDTHTCMAAYLCCSSETITTL